METGGIEDRYGLTIDWKIENIGVLKNSPSWCGVRSPIFIIQTLEKRKMFVELFPNSVMGTGEPIQIYLSLLGDPLNFPIDCEWSLIGCNGSPLVSGTKRNHFMNGLEPFYMSGCPTHEEVFIAKKSVFLLHDTLTVRFRIWSSQGNLSDDEFVSCRTRCEVTNYTFQCTVNEFSALQFYQDVTVPMTLDLMPDNFLWVFPFKGVSLQNAHLNVELDPLSITSALLAKLKVSVLDREEKVMKILETDAKYFSLTSKDTWILPKLISKEELLRVGCDCLRNDVLTMLCEIPTVKLSFSIEKYYYGCLNMQSKVSDNAKESTMFLEASVQTMPENDAETSESSLQKKDNMAALGEDLLILYREQGLSDFELRSGDVVFKVHKNILSARSPVFKAMFSTDMKEAPSSYQDVLDIDVHTLSKMLTFLYGDTMEPDPNLESVAKLYYAADKYQILSLKQQCSLIIQSSIQVSNVSDILALADRHHDSEMMSFVDEFFLNHFDEIVQSDDWETFQAQNPALAGKTVLRLCKKKIIYKLP